MNTSHKWHFFRSGGFDQVRLETGEDIRALAELDPKLWAALSCPVNNLEFDRKTLEFLDIDQDGHIRVTEIIAAVNWAIAMLKDPASLLEELPQLPLQAIDDSSKEGAALLASAKQILHNLGKGGVEAISIEDTADLTKIFASTKFNGDGIVPPTAAADTETQTVIEEIMTCAGSELDRSGSQGVAEENTNHFFDEAHAYSEWWQQAEQDANNILILGEATEAAKTAFDNIKTKVDDYFTRCSLAKFDSHASGALNPALASYEALAGQNLSAVSEQLIDLPLARIAAGQPLSLAEGINPAWLQAITTFKDQVVTPLIGVRDRLTSEEWENLCQKFAAHQVWLDNKQGATVEGLGIQRVRSILSGGYQDKILALIQKDKSLASASDAIESVEKLIRYHHHLFRLLNNFVSFRDFYTGRTKAVFQAGTLYLDGRSCDFCLHIDDVAQHSTMATLSGTYLAYCACTRRDDDTQQMNIVAAFTNGDADNLMVGRNGIFYDRQGQDWEATITKIVEHPISVRQAFWYPYKRIGKMIGEQIEKFTSAREQAVQDRAAASIADTAQAAESKAPPAPFDVGKFAGIFAAIGLAIGAIGTAIASVVTGFLSLVWWQMPLAILGLILIISGPSVLLAYLKLRKRSLAPLLDANGWAINTRAIINIPFGTSLTQIAALPPGAQRSLSDPYAEKKTPWKSYLFILLLLGGLAYLWRTGYINENTVDQLRDRVTNLIEGERSTADEAEKEGAEEMETVEPETELVPENEVDEVVTTTTPAAVIDAVVPAAKPAHAE
ncbi:hypothetical protein Nstercoris_00860 [Nitrosomonas stercoris]|uniref:EF-hand domain-containing protein n=1 Tax=Nitrosomonas stercoris TaxID=1444684 RepID=A0A4Y1YNN8_9PROT|nr:hypothetical protein Nstercoris_00860 [Nitrosomonas stercoris]